jgi:hypothetical protein
VFNRTDDHAVADLRETRLADAQPPEARALIEQGLRVARGTAAERAAFHAGYASVAGDPGIDGIEVVTELRRIVLFAEASLAAGKPLPDAEQLAAALYPFQGQITVKARVRFHPQHRYTALPRLDVRLGTGFSMQPALEVGARPLADRGGGEPLDGRPFVGAVVEATFRACAECEPAIQTLVMHVDNVYLMVATIDFTRMP